MSLDDIKPSELVMLRFVIGEANLLDTEDLERLHDIEKAARSGSLDGLTDELSTMYTKVRKQKAS